MAAKQKILIVIGDAGGGHLSAAKAIIETFNKLYNNRFSIEVIDIFSETNVPPFSNSTEFYIKVNKSPMAEMAYNFIALILSTRFGYFLYKRYVIAKLYRNSKAVILSRHPDLIIANNSIITPVVEAMKKDGGYFKTAVLVTDIVRIFRGWADRYADLVISPTREATKRLIRFGVAAERIREPLFPVNPRLVEFRPRDVVLRELDLDTAGQKTILVTAGGFGVPSLQFAINTLIAVDGLQIIVLAGRVEEFRKELEERYRGNPRIRILGFVPNIQDYYNASDIIVGKPGPATIMETDLFQKKAVLTRHVGVQETGNAEFAIKNPNFRSVGARWWRLKKKVMELLETNGAVFPRRRSFDECENIVRELVKLLDNEEKTGTNGEKNNQGDDIKRKKGRSLPIEG